MTQAHRAAEAPGDDLSQRSLWQIVAGPWLFETVAAAVEVGLLHDVAAHPGDPSSSVARRLSLDEPTLGDVLAALVDAGCLHRSGDGHVCTDEALRRLVRPGPDNIEDYVRFCQRSFNPRWAGIGHVLRHGTPPTAAVASPYDELYEDTELTQAFLGSMGSAAHRIAEQLLDVVDWSRHRVVADVGGADGELVRVLVGAQASLRGIVVDLPAVEPHFRDASSHDDRVRFEAADMFRDALPTADAVILGHVLHNWDHDAARRILLAAFEAVEPGGSVYVYDQMSDPGRPRSGVLSSLGMRVWTAGGAEYTVDDCTRWLAEVGFDDTDVRLLGRTGDTLVSATRPG